MRTQLLDAGIVDKQGIYTTCVQKPKRTLEGKIISGKKPKGWQYPPPKTEEEEDEALDEPYPQEESQNPMEPDTQGGSPQD